MRNRIEFPTGISPELLRNLQPKKGRLTTAVLIALALLLGLRNDSSQDSSQTMSVDIQPKAQDTSLASKEVQKLAQQADAYYDGTFEISKGVNFRTSPHSTELNTVPWDSILTVNGTDITGTDRFWAVNPLMVNGGHPSVPGSLYNSPWLAFETKERPFGLKRILYVNYSFETNDNVKPVEGPISKIPLRGKAGKISNLPLNVGVVVIAREIK